MFTPPFFIATGSPAAGDVQNAYPSAEQQFREMIVSALAREHDVLDANTNFSGHHKFGVGTTTARNAITDWVVGSIWLSTDTTPATLQRVVSIGPVVWENLGLGANQNIQQLTPGVSVNWDMSQGDAAALLASNASFTLNNPTNLIPGRNGELVINQDATGNRVITWGSIFKFPGGVKFVLSTAPNATDVISWRVGNSGTAIFCLGIAKALS